MVKGGVVIEILYVTVVFGVAELLNKGSQYLGETIDAFAELDDITSAISRSASSYNRSGQLTSAFLMPHFSKSAGFLSLIALTMQGTSLTMVLAQPRLKQDPRSPLAEMFA